MLLKKELSFLINKKRLTMELYKTEKWLILKNWNNVIIFITMYSINIFLKIERNN